MNHFKVQTIDTAFVIEFKHGSVNCLTPDIMDYLGSILSGLKHLEASKRPRTVILKSGIPKVFSHGMDPAYFVAADMDERKRVFVSLANLMEVFYKLGIPVVAEINGPAMAGGAVLALLADFSTISADHGKICFSETKVGLPVPEVIQQLIRFRLTANLLNDVVLLGKNFDAHAAHAAGMVNHIHQDQNEANAYVQDLCARFSRIAPEVIASTLNDSKRGLLPGKEKFIDSLDDCFGPFLTDEFLGKGLKALIAGQKPSW
jgi:enoyl-CoA hydratase/carnithine racemase